MIRAAAVRSSLPSCRAASGMNSTVQAKVAHQLIHRDGRLPRAAVGLQSCSTEVSILQVVQALLDQLSQLEGLGPPVSEASRSSRASVAGSRRTEGALQSTESVYSG